MRTTTSPGQTVIPPSFRRDQQSYAAAKPVRITVYVSPEVNERCEDDRHV